MTRAIDTATLDPDTVRESLEFIAQGLRPADRDEIAATVGADQDPFWALFESWEASARSWLIVDPTGLPLGIFGVAPHAAPGLGVAWLIGTTELERHGTAVARQTRAYVEQMHELFPTLWANVDARNGLSMRWLEWAGFLIADADPAFGPEGRLFIAYTRTPSSVPTSSSSNPARHIDGRHGGQRGRADQLGQ